MESAPWSARKPELLKVLHMGKPSTDMESTNIAVEIISLESTGGECIVLDLGLSNTFQEAPRSRKPVRTHQLLSFAGPIDPKLKIGDNCMLVGARYTTILGPVPGTLCWPQLSSETGCIRLSTSSQAIPEMAELFAGGLNAWSQAAAFLPVSITMRVDNKLLATQTMKVNEIVKQSKGDGGLAEIQHSDVADTRTMAKLQNEEAFLSSPPCQPFSAMGRGQGLDAIAARSWDRLFQAARLSQRRFLLIENVCGLPKHADFPEIKQALQYCGYNLVAMRKCDATTLGCAARPRIIMIFWNNADWREKNVCVTVPSIASLCHPIPCTQAGSLWKRLPQHMLEDLLLNEEEMMLLGRRDSLPPWHGRELQGVWEARKVKLDRPFPSITAAYHRSTQLPSQHVKSKGLHVPLVETAMGFRRLCKWEILHSMGAALDTVLPCDEASAVSLLGESFPPAHAFEGILLALAIHPERAVTQCEVDAYFHAGIRSLSPVEVDWDEMTQVVCQGWSKLVLRDVQPAEECSFSVAIQHMWATQGIYRVSFPCMGPVVHINELPEEGPFFSTESDYGLAHVRLLRPGCPPRCITVAGEDDLNHNRGTVFLATLWDIDPKCTVHVMVRKAVGCKTILVDEATPQKRASMKLVMRDGLLRHALWWPAETALHDVVSSLGLQAGEEVRLNGELLQETRICVQDGDVLEWPTQSVFADRPDACTRLAEGLEPAPRGRKRAFSVTQGHARESMSAHPVGDGLMPVHMQPQDTQLMGQEATPVREQPVGNGVVPAHPEPVFLTRHKPDHLGCTGLQDEPVHLDNAQPVGNVCQRVQCYLSSTVRTP